MKNKILLKTVSLIIIQIFVLTGLACPDTLRVPLMYGNNENNGAGRSVDAVDQLEAGSSEIPAERYSFALRAVLFSLKAGSYLWHPIFAAVLILGPMYGIVTERSTL